MERIRAIIAEIAPADSVERYTGLGVDVRSGHANIVDPWTVEVNGERLDDTRDRHRRGRRAGDSRPAGPGRGRLSHQRHDVGGACAGGPSCRARLVILGGGPIGVEMAQAFARLGSQVTLVHRGARILPKEDEDVAAAIDAGARATRASPCAWDAEAVRVEGKSLVVIDGASANEIALPFDEIIVAVGRKAAAQGLRARGARHRHRPAARDQCLARDALPQHLRGRRRRRAPSSSPMPPRTRPGTRRSTPCSAASGNSAPTIRCCPGSPSPIPRSRMSAITNSERAGGGDRLRGRALRSRPSRPRALRRRGPGLRQAAGRAGQGPHPRRDDRRPQCGRDDRRDRAGDEAQDRPQASCSARSTPTRPWPRPTKWRPANGARRTSRSGCCAGSSAIMTGGGDDRDPDPHLRQGAGAGQGEDAAHSRARRRSRRDPGGLDAAADGARGARQRSGQRRAVHGSAVGPSALAWGRSRST